LLLAVASAVVGLLTGAVPLDAREVLAVAGTDRLILLQVRLPRVLLAAIVGAALAVSGAALQPTLRNPLASPDIIGVSGGAALAAVTALALPLVAPRFRARSSIVCRSFVAASSRTRRS
jgi:iron complex transport system permease protein